MSVTAGVISLVSKSDRQVVLSCTAATAGTGPYTYQWYRSTTTGFSPGGGNILTGKTGLSLTDTDVIPGTQYYYKNVATDTGDSNLTSTSAQLAVATSNPVPIQNQFAMSPQLGQVDLRPEYSVIGAIISPNESATLYAATAVKMDTAPDTGGAPPVLKCTANTDSVLGFLVYNIKNQAFLLGDAAEVAMKGACIWLYATAAIARGARVALDITTNGGVQPLSGSGAECIVGWAFDKAVATGDLIRVVLLTPSFLADGS